MMPDPVVTRLSQPPPRISALGQQVVEEIAARCAVDVNIVLRAMLTVALHHQRELQEAITTFAEIGC